MRESCHIVHPQCILLLSHRLVHCIQRSCLHQNWTIGQWNKLKIAVSFKHLGCQEKSFCRGKSWCLRWRQKPPSPALESSQQGELVTTWGHSRKVKAKGKAHTQEHQFSTLHMSNRFAHFSKAHTELWLNKSYGTPAALALVQSQITRHRR